MSGLNRMASVVGKIKANLPASLQPLTLSFMFNSQVEHSIQQVAGRQAALLLFLLILLLVLLPTPTAVLYEYMIAHLLFLLIINSTLRASRASNTVSLLI